MKPFVKVTRDDMKNVIENINAMTGKRVLIGIPDANAGRKDGQITNAALGYIHENGSPARNIPARPFLIPGVQEAAPRAIEALKKYAAQGLTDPEAVNKGLNAAGLIAQAAVKNRIVNSVGFAPLAPVTIAQRRRKGKQGSKPLIRTGQLLNSITYVVKG
jgi:phage gpG-like protein